MSAPLQLTIDALTNSRNDAAASTLIASFEAAHLDNLATAVADGALTGLMGRRSKAGHLAVLGRWQELSEQQRGLVALGRGRMSGALRDGLLGDKQLFLNCCEVAEQLQEFDLIPTLVTIAEHPKNPRAPLALQLVHRLVDQLNQLLHGERETDNRRDPAAVRKFVLDSLERSVSRFRQHHRRELIDAFVTLAGAHCDTLRAILNDLHHPCFQTVVHTLTESQSPGVVHLLFEYLKQGEAPNVIRNVVSKRTDPAFIAALCSFVANTTNKHAKKNLARVTTYEWLEPVETVCERFGDQQLAQAAALVSISGLKDRQVINLAEQLLTHGGDATRLAACRLIAGCGSDRANELILAALEDPSPAVQAAATRQLRDRPRPDTMARLMKMVDSPHAEVQQAAREALDEFTFESYLSQFDQMDESVRCNKGALVARVDGDLIGKLAAEMSAATVKQRLRAIDMAEALNQLPSVADALVERLADDDHMVRASAADALQFCTGSDVRDALLAALSDQSAAVQNSAKSSLTNLGIPFPTARNAEIRR